MFRTGKGHPFWEYCLDTCGSCCHSNLWREQSPHLHCVGSKTLASPPLSLSQLLLYQCTLTCFLIPSYSFPACQNRCLSGIVAMFPLFTFCQHTCSCLNQFLSRPIMSLLFFLFTSLPSDSNDPPIAQCLFLSISHSPSYHSLDHSVSFPPPLPHPFICLYQSLFRLFTIVQLLFRHLTHLGVFALMWFTGLLRCDLLYSWPWIVYPAHFVRCCLSSVLCCTLLSAKSPAKLLQTGQAQLSDLRRWSAAFDKKKKHICLWFFFFYFCRIYGFTL